MIKTISELLDVIGELEHKETPIHYIYSFLGGKERLRGSLISKEQILGDWAHPIEGAQGKAE